MKNINSTTIIACLLIFLPEWSEGQNSYLRTYVAREPEKNPAVLTYSPPEKVHVSTEYYDGLGRNKQTVGKNASAAGGDIVSLVEFDEMGRPKRTFLPYAVGPGLSSGGFREDAFNEQQSYYMGRFGDTVSYSENLYENSPMNRVIKTAHPGNFWKMGSGRETKSEERPNVSGDNVYIFKVNPNGLPVSNGEKYEAGSLWVSITYDEHNTMKMKFVDKLGHTVLTKEQFQGEYKTSQHSNFIQTYYIYDDMDNLRVVMSPRAFQIILGDWWGVTVNPLLVAEQYYLYTYDSRRRVTRKKIPGKGEERFLYDIQDRLVGYQDSTMRAAHTWKYFKFDALGRDILSGLTVDSDSHAQVQAKITGPNNSKLTGINLPSATGGWPSDEGEVLTAMGYDGYGLVGGFAYQKPPGQDDYPEATTNVKGLPTVTVKKNLEQSKYLVSVLYYDDRGREVLTDADHHMDGSIRQHIKYDFENRPVKSNVTLSGNVNWKTDEIYNYKISGALSDKLHSFNSGPFVKVNETEYFETGELKSKSFPVGGQTYDYQIRGWLSTIGSQEQEVFKQEMFYGSTGFNPSWNGSPSRINWSGQSGEMHQYDFVYDLADRLVAATYSNLVHSSHFGRYSVDSMMHYDMNGNITTLNRRGKISGETYGFVDKLRYEYPSNNWGSYSNKIARVRDDITSVNHEMSDFKPNLSSTQDYGYDANGNLTSDPDKRIASISYNHLNLPRQIVFENNTGKIEFDYDANGSKLQQRVYTGNTLSTTRDYIADFVFTNGQLEFVSHGEGRVFLEGGQPIYEYFVKDHLGNVRQVLRDAAVQTFMATMEIEASEEENTHFYQLDETRQTDVQHNITAGGDKVAWLNADRGRILGPNTSKEVFEGEQVSLSVHGKYADSKSKKANKSALLPGGVLERVINDAGELARGGNPNAATVLQLFDLIAKDLQKRKTPEAYLFYALYDKDSVLYKTGKQVLSQKAANQHEKLEETFYIQRSGYMETFVANETVEDVWFDNYMVSTTPPLVVQETHYDPWGLELEGLGYQYEGIKKNRYLYNGKELIEDNALQYYDYGARMYDSVIGRWGVVDPLADIAPDRTPYHFVSNNPINRIDPDGLTDFTVNKKTGEITQEGETNDDPDRILRTNRKGDVKYNKNGEAKVAIDDISKGILEDGLNLQENDVTFKVNGDGQPTLEGFNSFISRFSDYVGKEIAGIRLGEADSEQVLKVKTHKYNKSTKVESQTPKSWLTRYGDYLKGHFHTHPYHDHTPSEKDERLKSQYPNILFYIIAGGHEKKF